MFGTELEIKEKYSCRAIIENLSFKKNRLEFYVSLSTALQDQMLANSKYNIAAGNLWAILTLCQISIIAEEKCIDLLYLIGTAQLGLFYH